MPLSITPAPPEKVAVSRALPPGATDPALATKDWMEGAAPPDPQAEVKRQQVAIQRMGQE